MALATVFGTAGVVLVLVGLIGGGFTFSGSIMPTVGPVSRVLSFGVGGLLLLVSLGVALPLGDSPGQAGPDPVPTDPPPSDPSAPGSSAPGAPPAPPVPVSAPPPPPDVFPLGQVVVPADTTALVFQEPSTASVVVTELPGGAVVEIVCTALGEAVTSPVTGATSDLWNWTTDGGFVPDALVDTGTDAPVAPAC